MQYTRLKHTGAIHTQVIQPLDKRIVRIAFSSKIDGFKDNISHSLLTLYTYLALSGTKKYSKEEIQSRLKRNGIVLDVATHNGFVTYSMTVDQAHLSTALLLLIDIVFTISIKQSQFNNVRSLVLEEIREAHDNARAISEMYFLNTIYPKHSLNRVETLEEQKHYIQASSISDIRTVAQSVRSGEWFISIVGNNKSVRVLDTFIDKLSKSSQLVTRGHETYTVGSPCSHFVTIPGKTNVEVRIGSIVPITLHDDDYAPFLFGINVLGRAGGFSGRLMSTVREREGLTYMIYAQVVHPDSVSTGHWNISTFFTGHDLKQGLASTMREVKQIVGSGITQQELERFKEIVKNQFLINHESNMRRLMLYHNILLKGLTESDLQGQIERVRDLTIAEVNTALRKYLKPDRFSITGAGPVTKGGTGII